MDLETERTSRVAGSCHSKRKIGSRNPMPIVWSQDGRFEQSVQDRCIAIREFREGLPVARSIGCVFDQHETSMGIRLVGRRLSGLVRHVDQGTASGANLVCTGIFEGMTIGRIRMAAVPPKRCWRCMRTAQRFQCTPGDERGIACFGTPRIYRHESLPMGPTWPTVAGMLAATADSGPTRSPNPAQVDH